MALATAINHRFSAGDKGKRMENFLAPKGFSENTEGKSGDLGLNVSWESRVFWGALVASSFGILKYLKSKRNNKKFFYCCL